MTDENAAAEVIDFLFRNTSDFLFLVDGAARVLDSSESARAALRLPRGGRGFPIGVLFAEKERGPVAAAIAAFLSGPEGDGTLAELTAKLSLPGAEAAPALISMRRLRPDDGSERNSGFARALVLVRPVAYPDFGRLGPLVTRVLEGYGTPALVVAAKSLRVRGCNRAAQDLLGLRREELVGSPLERLAETGLLPPAFRREAKAAFATAGVFPTRLRLRRKDGRILACACTAIGLFDGRGVLVDILGILHDRSEVEERMAEIRRISETMLRAATELDRRTSSFSDLRDLPKLSGFGLTERQIAIARLVATGACTKSIANELGIAEATVKGHITAIFRKMGVASRTELVASILERRLAFS